jgi:hypothetical protein
MGTNANTLPPEHQNLDLAAREGTRLYFSGPPSYVTARSPTR